MHISGSGHNAKKNPKFPGVSSKNQGFQKLLGAYQHAEWLETGKLPDLHEQP